VEAGSASENASEKAGACSDRKTGIWFLQKVRRDEQVEIRRERSGVAKVLRRPFRVTSEFKSFKRAR
jgi:hypothetical protein